MSDLRQPGNLTPLPCSLPAQFPHGSWVESSSAVAVVAVSVAVADTAGSMVDMLWENNRCMP